MNVEDIEEINTRLKAPAIALERIAKGRHLSKIFAVVALGELKEVKKIFKKLATRMK